MTMTRSAKNDSTGTLKRIIGGAQVKPESPRTRAEMVKDHGTPTYTPGAWIKGRMGRGRMDVSRLDRIIEKRRTMKIQSQRKTNRTK